MAKDSRDSFGEYKCRLNCFWGFEHGEQAGKTLEQQLLRQFLLKIVEKFLRLLGDGFTI